MPAASALSQKAGFRRRRRRLSLLLLAGVAAIPAGGLFASYQLFGFRSVRVSSSSMEPGLRGPDAGGAPGDLVRVETVAARFRRPNRGEVWLFRAPPQASPEEKHFLFRVIGLPGETLEIVPPRLLVDGKTALRLAAGTIDGRSLPIDAGRLPVRVTGSEARIPGEFTRTELRVVARPEPKLRISGERVLLDGRVVLKDEEWGLTAERRLSEYGAEPGVEGTLLLRDEPVLLVLKGHSLAYDPGHVLVDGRRLDEPYVREEPRYSMSPVRLGADEFLLLGDNRNNANDGHVWGPLRRERLLGRAAWRVWPPERAGAP